MHRPFITGTGPFSLPLSHVDPLDLWASSNCLFVVSNVNAHKAVDKCGQQLYSESRNPARWLDILHTETESSATRGLCESSGSLHDTPQFHFCYVSEIFATMVVYVG